jgi:hypothetical protein
MTQQKAEAVCRNVDLTTTAIPMSTFLLIRKLSGVDIGQNNWRP